MYKYTHMCVCVKKKKSSTTNKNWIKSLHLILKQWKEKLINNLGTKHPRTIFEFISKNTRNLNIYVIQTLKQVMKNQEIYNS